MTISCHLCYCVYKTMHKANFIHARKGNAQMCKGYTQVHTTRSARNPITYWFLFSLTQLSICKSTFLGSGPCFNISTRVSSKLVRVRLQSWATAGNQNGQNSPAHVPSTQSNEFLKTTNSDRLWTRWGMLVLFWSMPSIIIDLYSPRPIGG